MDANIKTTQDALKWIECRIREEVDCDGEMTNDHAIELAFIGAMLDKFPTRNCDKYDCAEEAWNAYVEEKGPASDRSWKSLILFSKWLFSPADGGQP